MFQESVGGSAKHEKLFLRDRNVGGQSIYSSVAGGSLRTIEFRMVDLDTALSRLGAECDLIRLDCEGAEYEILMSMTNAHAARVSRIVFEPTPAIYKLAEVSDHLVELGY